jgi:hypothetical protein
MKLVPYILDRFVKTFLTGGAPFESAKRIVKSLDNEDLTNEEKKFLAVTQLKTFGYKLMGFVVSAAIDLAVVYLRLKTGKKLTISEGE